MLMTVLLVLLVIALCGGFARAGNDFAAPGGLLGLIIIVLIVLLLTGYRY
jgi:hypothetical protein